MHLIKHALIITLIILGSSGFTFFSITKRRTFTAATTTTTSLKIRRGNLNRILDEASEEENLKPFTPSPIDGDSGTEKKKGKEGRKERKKQSAAVQADIDRRVDEAVAGFNNCIGVEKGEKRDLVELQRIIEEDLRPLAVNNLKTTIRKSTLTDYKLCFAGSDDAVCAMGSGLHKVPLANLDEIYLTIGNSRVFVREVIRIIGPFPNVLNSLIGDATTSKGVLTTTYTSIVDGTGKELVNAPNEERKVSYEIAFASEEYLVLYHACDSKRSINNLLILERVIDLEAELTANRVGSKKTNLI